MYVASGGVTYGIEQVFAAVLIQAGGQISVAQEALDEAYATITHDPHAPAWTVFSFTRNGPKPEEGFTIRLNKAQPNQ